MVLLHGYTGNSRNWALTVPALVQHPFGKLRAGFRTISPDLRGHGFSAKPAAREAYRFETMAGDVYGLLRHLGVDACYLAGHSMGGMAAQHLVLEYPALVRALVLVDTAAAVSGLLAGPRRAERLRLIEIAKTQGMEAVFEEQLKLSPERDRLAANPQFVALWREQFLMTAPQAYIHCGEGLGARPSLLGELRNVRTPTLIICGENDEPFREPSRQMHEAIPDSELVIIQGAGHGPQMERPSEFNRALLGFLERVHAKPPLQSR